MIDLKLDVKGIASLERQLKDVRKNQLPFASSRAMFKTVSGAKRDAAKAAKKKLDRPTPALTNEKLNGGWIRVAWPSKADVSRGFKRANGDAVEAKVFIIDGLVDEIHAVVFGGIQRRVPDRGDHVVEPTKVLLDGLQGAGKLKSLNKHGNIAGFFRGVLSRLRDDPRYLNVPLFNTDPKLKHLQPGLYFVNRRIVQGRVATRLGNRLVRANRTLSASQKRRGYRVDRSLTMLLRYSRFRTLKPSRWNYPEIVGNSYRRNYVQHFRTEFRKAIRTRKR